MLKLKVFHLAHRTCKLELELKSCVRVAPILESNEPWQQEKFDKKFNRRLTSGGDVSLLVVNHIRLLLFTQPFPNRGFLHRICYCRFVVVFVVVPCCFRLKLGSWSSQQQVGQAIPLWEPDELHICDDRGQHSWHMRFRVDGLPSGGCGDRVALLSIEIVTRVPAEFECGG